MSSSSRVPEAAVGGASPIEIEKAPTRPAAPLGAAPAAAGPATSARGDVGIRTFIALASIHLMIDCFGGIWPVFKKLASLDLFMAGLIATMAGMIGTATQPFFGLWADRTSRRRFVLIGGVMSFGGMMLGPLSMLIGQSAGAAPAGAAAPHGLIDSIRLALASRTGNAIPMGLAYLAMFAIMLSVRVGQDMFHPAGVGAAGSFSPRRRSMLVAMFVSAGAIGFGLSQIVFSAVYKAAGRHTELLLIPGLAIWLLAVTWCRPPDQPAGDRPTMRSALGGIRAAGWPLLNMFMILALSAALNIGLHFLLPELSRERRYPEWIQDGGAFMFLILGSAVMMIPAGLLADHVGRRKMLLVMLVLAAAGYQALVWLPLPLGGFILMLLLAGGFLGTVNPLGIAIGQHLAPRNVSMVSALMMGAAWCLGSTAPAIVGWLAKPQRLGVVDTLIWLGTVNVLMIALGVLMPRRRTDEH